MYLCLPIYTYVKLFITSPGIKTWSWTIDHRFLGRIWYFFNISVWYGNSSSQDCKALQRVVRLAERISGSALPSLQDIYIKRCRGRADKIIKDSNHPGNCLFTRLPSGKRFRCLMAKTERLRGVSSPRPSGSWTQSQPLKNIIWLTSNH